MVEVDQPAPSNVMRLYWSDCIDFIPMVGDRLFFNMNNFRIYDIVLLTKRGSVYQIDVQNKEYITPNGERKKIWKRLKAEWEL